MERKIIIESLARCLDITPKQYQEAVSRYNHLTSYIKNQNLEYNTYLQGSFRLGTVIRPYARLEERDYDMDIVCELPYRDQTEYAVKNDLGDIIKKSNYNRYLAEDGEGTRCWTLEYKEQDAEGFHIDLLPCRKLSANEQMDYVCRYPKADVSSIVMLTHKISEGKYKFKSTNPDGFSKWFHNISNNILDWSPAVERYKIFQEHENFFKNTLGVYQSKDVDEVYVRSPLQKAIQVLKRHRDYMFAGKPEEHYKPISIIITVIVSKIAEKHNGRFSDTEGLLKIVLEELKDYHKLDSIGVDSDFLQFGEDRRLIVKKPRAEGWEIKNPVNPEENLADRWAEDDNARAKCFFKWLKNVESFMESLLIYSTKEADVRQVLNQYYGPALSKKVFDRITAQSSITNVTEIRHTPKPYHA